MTAHDPVPEPQRRGDILLERARTALEGDGYASAGAKVALIPELIAEVERLRELNACCEQCGGGCGMEAQR